MNWNAVEGNWKLIKGKAKVKWGRMTGDPFSVIAGRQEQMTGRIQKNMRPIRKSMAYRIEH